MLVRSGFYLPFWGVSFGIWELGGLWFLGCFEEGREGKRRGEGRGKRGEGRGKWGEGRETNSIIKLGTSLAGPFLAVLLGLGAAAWDFRLYFCGGTREITWWMGLATGDAWWGE